MNRLKLYPKVSPSGDAADCSLYTPRCKYPSEASDCYSLILPAGTPACIHVHPTLHVACMFSPSSGQMQF